MLGIVPIYGMTNYQYAPALTKGQKFDLMSRAYITVFPYLAAGFQAGLSQATNSFEGRSHQRTRWSFTDQSGQSGEGERYAVSGAVEPGHSRSEEHTSELQSLRHLVC